MNPPLVVLAPLESSLLGRIGAHPWNGGLGLEGREVEEATSGLKVSRIIRASISSTDLQLRGLDLSSTFSLAPSIYCTPYSVPYLPFSSLLLHPRESLSLLLHLPILYQSLARQCLIVVKRRFQFPSSQMFGRIRHRLF